MRKYLIATLFIIQSIFIALCFANLDFRDSFKTKLLRADLILFDGFFRRTYHGQHIPQLSLRLAPHSANDYGWCCNNAFIVIGHGLGPELYGGINTLKTLEMGWERGFRIFEVDLSVTSDNHLVCYHGGDEREIDNTTYLDYLKVMKSENHPPCNFSDIVRYARQHPDVRFVLDVKNRFYDAYAMVRREIGDRCLGKSFIPQVYYFEQLPAIREGNFFAGEIFTSYRSALTNQQIFDAAQKYDVRVVALTTERFFNQKEKFPKDISILTHSINDPFIAYKVRKLEGRGIYTSYITPLSIPELFSSNN